MKRRSFLKAFSLVAACATLAPSVAADELVYTAAEAPIPVVAVAASDWVARMRTALTLHARRAEHELLYGMGGGTK